MTIIRWRRAHNDAQPASSETDLVVPADRRLTTEHGRTAAERAGASPLTERTVAQDSVSNDAAGAALEPVLAEFAQLRRAVLQVLDAGEQAGAALGAHAQQVTPLFTAARQSVDLCRLNLTVIGAEGVGKSTLINAIAGADLTPRERDHPGTVAPTYAEAGSPGAPSYRVTVRDSDGREREHRCADLDEFRGYLLQHENRENVRGVVRGVVLYDHPALRRGLRLVDMPGVHASSPLVNQEARRFLRHDTHAVVAVTYGRTGYGALHEVFDDLAVERDLVQAVVINQELGYFATSSLAMLPDADLRTKMEETRHAAAQELGIAAERIFLLNLASYYGTRVHGRPPLDAPAHAEELRRFEQHLWSYIRENGVAEVIDRAADDATTALHAVSARLDLAQRAISAVTEGDRHTTKELKASFARARAQAAETWGAVSTAPVAAAVSHRHWPPLKAAADHARDAITLAVDSVLTEMQGQPGRIGGRQASLWKGRLQSTVLGERDVLDAAYGGVLRDVLAYYGGHADAALAQLYEQVPLLAGAAPADRLTVGGAGLMLTHLGRMEPGAVEQIAKWGAAGGAGALSGKIAGGGGTALLVAALGMNPITALAVGGVAGTSAALLLWRFARDEHRDALQSGLTRYRSSALAALDTSPGGSLRREWDAAVLNVATRVGEELETQIGNVTALLSAPNGAHAPALQQREADLAHASASIEDARSALDWVRSRAETLA